MIRTSLVVGLALVMAPALSGCPAANQSKELTDADKKATPPVEDHAHEHGPHDGEVVELGEYHGEVALESDRKATLYILGADVKTAVPLADATATLELKVGTETTKIELKAKPLDGEADGKTSRFQSEAPLPEAIKDVHDIAGDVTVTVAGKPIKGEVGHHH